MTKREQQILILVGVVICGGLVFNFWPRVAADSTEVNGNSGSQLHEANHLLRSRLNIIARNKDITAKLNVLQKRFFTKSNLETSKVNLLKEVEGIAAQSNLDVQQKTWLVFMMIRSELPWKAKPTRNH